MDIDGVRLVPWRRELAAGGANSRGAWAERRGWLVVVEHGGMRGIGEASALPEFGRAAASAAMRFGLETAMLDAVARERGVSVAEVLVAGSGERGTEDGGRGAGDRMRDGRRVVVNAVVADAGEARAAVKRGIGTLKVKVGEDHEEVMAVMREIRDAVPGVVLRVDANQGWPLAQVEQRLAAMAELGLAYVEEPAAGLAAMLRRPLAVPVALDESLAAADREVWLDRALGSGAVGAIVLKPTLLGGMRACLALAARARRYGVEVVVTHALEGPVAMAACCELARAIAPKLAVGLDRHPGLEGWRVEVPQLQGVEVVAAAGSGLGIDVDAVIAEAEAA